MGESKTFKFALDQLTETGHDLLQFAEKNPAAFSLSVVTIAAGVATIVVPIAVGFGPAGPIAGSLAAAWMSEIGSVAAGSFFAMLQSLTMTGTLLAVGGGMIGVGAAGLLGGSECIKHLQERAQSIDWKKADPKELEWMKGEVWARKVEEVKMKCEGVGEQTQKGFESFGEQMKEGCEGAVEGVKAGSEGAGNEMKKACDDIASGTQSAFGG